MIKVTANDMICPKCGRTSIQKMASFDKKEIKGRLTFISTYRRRIFKIMDEVGKEYLCGFFDESQWDRIYDYLDTRNITVFVVGEEEDKLLVELPD